MFFAQFHLMFYKKNAPKKGTTKSTRHLFTIFSFSFFFQDFFFWGAGLSYVWSCYFPGSCERKLCSCWARCLAKGDMPDAVAENDLIFSSLDASKAWHFDEIFHQWQLKAQTVQSNLKLYIIKWVNYWRFPMVPTLKWSIGIGFPVLLKPWGDKTF